MTRPIVAPIVRMIDDAFAAGERRIQADQLAYDLMRHGDDAVHEIWIGSPLGLDLDDSNRNCPLCEQPNREGPAKSWWAGIDLLIGHGYCVSRAVRFGTPPGQTARFGEPGARVYVLPPEMIR